MFGSGLSVGPFGRPTYAPPDPNASPIANATSQLQQDISRLGSAGASPIANFFDPDGAKKARDEALQKTQQLQQLKEKQQQQTDIQKQATNFGVPSSQINPNMTGDTIDNYLLEQYKQGDPNAFKALQARGKTEWLQDYSGDFIQGQATNLSTANNAVTALNAAGDNQAAYKSALKSLNPKDRDALERTLRQEGVQGGIPDTAAKWTAASAKHGAAFAQMRQFVDQHLRQYQNMTNFDQGMPKEAADSIAAGITLGSTSEPAFDGKNAKIRGQDGQPGVVGPNGSVRTDKFGLSPSQGGWNASSAERLEKSDKMFAGEDVKGAVNQYNIANKFLHEATNDANYTSAAGIALLKDTLGGVGRDVAEKSAAAGTTGLSKMFSDQQGSFEGWLNKAQGELGAYQNWKNKGGVGQPPPSARISDETKAGLKAIAQENYKFAKEQGAGRLTGAMRYAGQIGRPLEDIPLDKDLKAEVSRYHEEGRIDAVNGFNSYPSLVRGNQRIYFQQGSNVNGAQGPRAPMAFPQPGQDNTDKPIASAPAGASGNPPAGSPPPSSGPAGGPNSPVATPAGGPTPGRYGVPPGMQLNTPQALDAAANRTIQIESGFRPGQQTGSYKGYGQWSDDEMRRHGITDPDDLGQTQAALKADIQTRAAKLQKDGLPVTASNVYLMHQQGEAGLEAHLRNPEGKAWENISQYYKSPAIAKQAVWGNMTPEMKKQFPGGVDSVTSGDFTRLWQARYDGTDGVKHGDVADAVSGRRLGLAATGRTAMRPTSIFDGAPSVPISQADVNPNVPGVNPGFEQEEENKKRGEINPGMVGGMAGSLVGGPAGGAAGGGAGQMLENYMRGDKVLQPNVVGSAAFGAAGGIPTAGLKGAALRAGTAAAGGGAQGGLENGVPGAVAGAVEGGVGAAVGEGVGRGGAGAANALDRFGGFLGMGGHQTFSRLTGEAQKSYLDAANTVAKGKPEKPASLPGGGPNQVAEKAFEEKLANYEDAEKHLKSVLPHVKPDEAAYAAQQVGASKGEGVIGRPVAAEIASAQRGYGELRSDTAVSGKARGLGAPLSAAGAIPDGPVSQLRTADNPSGKVPYSPEVEKAFHNAEMLATAPAHGGIAEVADNILKARSELLEQERTALGGASPDTTKAKALRAGAAALRPEIERTFVAAFGKDGAKVAMQRLDALDVRYARAMKLSGDGDIVGTIVKGGKAGRETSQAFKALTMGDVQAQRMMDALVSYRKGYGTKELVTYGALIAGELHLTGSAIVSVPLIAAKLASMLRDYTVQKGAGRPIKMDTLLNKGREPALNSAVAGRAGAVAGGREGASLGIP
jgi:hypothetical protein